MSLRAFAWQYTIQDHLGNTVVLFEDRDASGTIDTEIDVPPTEVEVLQRNYYSFGLEMDGPWQRLVDPEQDYLYNGKEKIAHEDVDLRWLNYGFRW